MHGGSQFSLRFRSLWETMHVLFEEYSSTATILPYLENSVQLRCEHHVTLCLELASHECLLSVEL